MGAFRVYLKPFDNDGSYKPDYIDITNDVLRLGQIKQDLDSSTYDIGVFRYDSVSLTLRNDHGRYLDQTSSRSIFEFKRQDSLIRITWSIRPEPLCVGFFRAGVCGPVGGEETVFDGFLNEVTSTADIDAQEINFSVLGLESRLEQITVPYDSISAPELLSSVIEKSLDQAPFNTVVSVESSNISLGLDQEIDSKTGLENVTVKELLGSKSALLLSSSVISISDSAAKVSSREPTDEVMFSFYGQASALGAENVIDIRKFRFGLNKTYNFWTWEDTSLYAEDITSIEKFGVRKKSLSSDIITDTTKRQNILNSNRDEFANPKLEFELTAPLNYDTLALKPLYKVDLDYPTVFVPQGEAVLPRWGQIIWGLFEWPEGKWSLTLTQQTKFKITAKLIDPNSETVVFNLREV